MTKRLAAAFGLGALTPLLFVLWLGGERLAVAGFRLAAIENGLKLAASDWQVDGVPAHQGTLQVAEVEQPVKKATARRK